MTKTETARQKKIIQQLKDFSEKNYERGYNVFVEAWDDEDWSGLVMEQNDIRSCKRAMKLSAGIWIERQGGLEKAMEDFEYSDEHYDGYYDDRGPYTPEGYMPKDVK